MRGTLLILHEGWSGEEERRKKDRIQVYQFVFKLQNCLGDLQGDQKNSVSAQRRYMIHFDNKTLIKKMKEAGTHQPCRVETFLENRRLTF